MFVPYKVKMLGRFLKRAWGQLYPEYLPDRFFLRCLDCDKLGLGTGSARAKELALRFHREKYGKHCRFFFEANELEEMRDLLGPAARDELIAAADRISAHEIPLLGHPRVDCGNPLAWDADPITKAHRPHGLFSRPLDIGADSRCYNELHLHRHFCVLAQAYCITKDGRFAQEILDQLEDWLRSYNPESDEDVTSALVCGVRVNCWIWALYALADFAGLSADVYWKILKSTYLHLRFIERELEPHAAANNHRIGEAWGLLVGGILLPEFRRAAHWRELGLEILAQEARAQFHADGGHKEKAPTYHRMVVDYYCQAILLCRQNGIRVSEELLGHVSRMFDFLVAIARPDSRLPSFGDGGMPTLGPDAELEEASTTAAVGAVLLSRGDLKLMARNRPERAIWLLGAAGWRSFADLPVREPDFVSRALTSSDVYVLRQDWSPSSSYLVFDCGQQGLAERPGHSHADALSVELSANGFPLLVDAGTYQYHGDKKWRDYFRGTAAHNTVLVDRQDQAVPGERSFLWKTVADARCNHCSLGGEIEFLDGEHEGYTRLHSPVVHRRRVVAVEGKFFLIFDELIGAGSHDLDLLFHFAPGSLRREDDGWNLLEIGGRDRLAVKILTQNPCSERTVVGDEDPIQGWYSRSYGVKEACPALVASQAGQLPLFFASALVPLDSCPVDEYVFSRSGPESFGFAFCHRDREDRIIFRGSDGITVPDRPAHVTVERRVQGRLVKSWSVEQTVEG